MISGQNSPRPFQPRNERQRQALVWDLARGQSSNRSTDVSALPRGRGHFFFPHSLFFLEWICMPFILFSTSFLFPWVSDSKHTSYCLLVWVAKMVPICNYSHLYHPSLSLNKLSCHGPENEAWNTHTYIRQLGIGICIVPYIPPLLIREQCFTNCMVRYNILVHQPMLHGLVF